ncbi:MAG TPA: hypothetical protein DHV04_02965 [Flavobacteriaceae bacterium]|nr:hypothetical protein [Flavobacteriaceae bacterium]
MWQKFKEVYNVKKLRLKKELYFNLLSSYGLLLLLSLLFFLIPKGTIESQVNLFQFPDLFALFYGITLLGDGWVLAVLLIFLLLFGKQFGIRRKDISAYFIGALYLIIMVLLFKNVVFEEALRPVAYFTQLPSHWDPSHFPIRFHRYHSFPSGHTATGALVGFFLMRFCKNRWKRLGMFSMILLVGYSRVFLFQHFLTDVAFGLLMGWMCVVMGYLTIYHNSFNRWYFWKSQRRVLSFKL